MFVAELHCISNGERGCCCPLSMLRLLCMLQDQVERIVQWATVEAVTPFDSSESH